MNKKTYITLGVIILILAGVIVFSQSTKTKTTAENDDIKKTSASSILAGQKATVYKSPNCGCCVGYIKELEKNGVKVEVVETNDMDSVKKDYNIPSNMQSCHTIVFDDYFVEGHVPIAAVEKLLTEKPEVDGIALPGMPSGTPGMPGSKRAPYEVYQLIGGESEEFITL